MMNRIFGGRVSAESTTGAQHKKQTMMNLKCGMMRISAKSLRRGVGFGRGQVAELAFDFLPALGHGEHLFGLLRGQVMLFATITAQVVQRIIVGVWAL